MRRHWWAVIVALVALDTGAGSYLWWLLDHKRPPLMESRVDEKTSSLRIDEANSPVDRYRRGFDRTGGHFDRMASPVASR